MPFYWTDIFLHVHNNITHITLNNGVGLGNRLLVVDIVWLSCYYMLYYTGYLWCSEHGGSYCNNNNNRLSPPKSRVFHRTFPTNFIAFWQMTLIACRYLVLSYFGSHLPKCANDSYEENKGEIWLRRMTKAPTPTEKSEKQRDITNTPSKTSITQILRTY